MSSQDMQSAVREVADAIRDEGPVPEYHRMVQQQHRRQWPTLWRALDRLLEAVPVEPREPVPPR